MIFRWTNAIQRWDTDTMSDCFRALTAKKYRDVAAQVKTLFHDVFTQAHAD